MRAALGLCLCIAVVGCYAQESVERIARPNEGDNTQGAILRLQISSKSKSTSTRYHYISIPEALASAECNAINTQINPLSTFRRHSAGSPPVSECQPQSNIHELYMLLRGELTVPTSHAAMVHIFSTFCPCSSSWLAASCRMSSALPLQYCTMCNSVLP